MDAQPIVPLILGGHSFIHQLGSDPQASEQKPAEIVSMRKVEWVRANVASWRRGPLADDERAWLDALVAAR